MPSESSMTIFHVPISAITVGLIMKAEPEKLMHVGRFDVSLWYALIVYFEPESGRQRKGSSLFINNYLIC